MVLVNANYVTFMNLALVLVVLWNHCLLPQGVILTSDSLGRYSHICVFGVAGGKVPALAQRIIGVEAPNPLRSGAAGAAGEAALTLHTGLRLTSIDNPLLHLHHS